MDNEVRIDGRIENREKSIKIVEGKVINIDGQGIAGACVKVLDVFSNPIAHTLTDGCGNFKLIIFGNNNCYKVFAACEGYSTSDFQHIFLFDGQKLIITIKLNKLENLLSYLIGRVVFNNKPVEMCQVELYSCYCGILTLCERTVTDKKGMFFIDGTPPGIYIIKAENNMFYYREKICLKKGLNSLTIYPCVKPNMMYGTISGVIVDSEGNRVKDALVVLQTKDGRFIKFTRTNSQGEYLFYNVEKGEDSIVSYAKKYD